MRCNAKILFIFFLWQKYMLETMGQLIWQIFTALTTNTTYIVALLGQRIQNETFDSTIGYKFVMTNFGNSSITVTITGKVKMTLAWLLYRRLFPFGPISQTIANHFLLLNLMISTKSVAVVAPEPGSTVAVIGSLPRGRAGLCNHSPCVTLTQ